MLVTLVVVLLAVGGMWLRHVWPKSKQPAVVQTISSQTYQQELSIVTYEDQLGKTSQALDQVNSYLSQNLTNVQRVGFLEEKAVMYMNENNISQALVTYQESQKLQNGKLDAATAQGLLYIYTKEGNVAQEANYCRKLNAATSTVTDPLAQANMPTCTQPSQGTQ